MKALLTAAVLIVAGCATVPETKTIYVTKTVEIPVREKCTVEIPPEPPWGVIAVDMGANLLVLSQSILADLEQSRDYIQQLRTNARKCQ